MEYEFIGIGETIMGTISNKIDSKKIKEILADMYGQQVDTQIRDVSIAGYTNIGKVRIKNEDNYLLNGSNNKNCESYKVIKNEQTDCKYVWRYFAVFDGMGGGENGEKASLIATQEFDKLLSGIDLCKEQTEIDKSVRHGFLNANNKIRMEQRDGGVCGTTATVLMTDGRRFKVYHIGDSRAYLIRNKKTLRLTKDQTLAELKTDVGIYDTVEEAPEREKHQLTEYVGRDYTGKSIKPLESEWMELLYGDRILICTDGLYDMCSDFEMEKIISENDNIENAIERLMEVALDNGGVDNLTCILLESK